MKLSPMKTLCLLLTGTILAACDNNDGNRNNIPPMVLEPPTITSIGNQTIEANETASGIAFVVADNQTAASNLTVSASSDNTALIPNTGLQISGSGANKVLMITPMSEQLGNANVTVTVTDADGGNASTSFAVSVAQQMLSVGEFAVQLFNDGPNDTPRSFDSRIFIDGGEGDNIYPDVVQ
jgi:hypothetical protein